MMALMTSSTDSIRLLHDDSIWRFHGRGQPQPIGRICKGHSISSAPASIPSKYQTMIMDNSDEKGFLSKARRFTHEEVNENPGPGTYIGIGSMVRSSASFSKRGSGMMPSRDKRISKWYAVNHSPGPASYSLQDGALSSRCDFNRSMTSVFHSPIALRSQPKDTGPAPNQYDVLRGVAHSSAFGSNCTSAGSAFKSKSKREIMDLREAIARPSPVQYNVNDCLLRQSVKIPVSSFRSSTGRSFPPKPPCGPGPGRYRPHEAPEPVVKNAFPRRHYLCLSAPAVPPPATPPIPGPGSYDIPGMTSQLSSRENKPTSSFVSQATRWVGDARKDNFPSPAHYKPQEVGGKQSFHYNADTKWI